MNIEESLPAYVVIALFVVMVLKIWVTERRKRAARMGPP